MPASSKKQQRAAGMAYAAKTGKLDPSKLKGAAKEMHDTMTNKEVKDFAETKHTGLPEKKASITMDNHVMNGFVSEINKEAGLWSSIAKGGIKLTRGIGKNISKAGWGLKNKALRNSRSAMSPNMWRAGDAMFRGGKHVMKNKKYYAAGAATAGALGTGYAAAKSLSGSNKNR